MTSNKPFGRWGEVFGDDVVAAAMIDNRSTRRFPQFLQVHVSACQQVSAS